MRIDGNATSILLVLLMFITTPFLGPHASLRAEPPSRTPSWVGTGSAPQLMAIRCTTAGYGLPDDSAATSASGRTADGLPGGSVTHMNGEHLSAQSAQARAAASGKFREAFDKYVQDDSVEGAAYVLVEDGEATEWHAIGMADRDLGQQVN